MNYAPFYLGQKVIAVDAHPKAAIKNRQIYIVNSCTYEESGNPISPAGKKYWYVGVVGFSPYLRPTIFAPVEEKKFPLMTFDKIHEIEKIEILILN